MTSTQDVTAPRITGVSIDPSSVDVTDGKDKTFTATMTATDDLSGVSGAYGVYNHGGQYLWFFFDRVAGDANNGSYRATAAATPTMPNGTYELLFFYVYDTVGNYHYYNPSDNVAPASLKVISAYDAVDTTPPTITSGSFTPDPVDVSDSVQGVTAELHATDDLSGVKYVYVGVSSPSGRQSTGFYAYPAQDDPGTLRGTFKITRYSEPGVWQVTDLCAYDNANNSRCYYNSTTPKIGDVMAPTFRVASNPADLIKPAVTAFRVSPGAIDVTDGPKTVTVSFDVTDDLSGVQYARVNFASPSTVGASPEIIDRGEWAWAPFVDQAHYQSQGVSTYTQDDSLRLHAGTLTTTVTFPRYDRSGNWTITELCVYDNVQWSTCYTPSSTPSLSDLGPTELTVKWNRAPVVSVTGVTGSTYPRGSEPTPGCAVSDVEDGTPTVSPVVTGPDASGAVTVTCSYTDTGGLTGSATKSYTVVKPSNTAPSVTVTGVEQAHYNTGAEPTAGCAVTDAEDGTPSVAPHIVRSDAEHTVTVTCSYTDAGGLTASASKTYTLNTAPTVTVTGVEQARYNNGAEPTAGCAVTDAEDGTPTVTPHITRSDAEHTVTVTCSYTDAGGLTASASKTYTLNTAPTVAVTGIQQTSYESGAVPAAGCAVDDMEDSGESAVPILGAVTGPLASYGLGTVTVTCSYTDAGGLTGSASTTYTVVDTTAPSLGLGPVSAPATGASGATVTYPATATDAVDPKPTVACTPASGSVFPIGTTTVACTATDVSGNRSSGSFALTVRPACTSSSGGLQAPINPDGSSVFKIGSTIPVKTTLTCWGTTPDLVRPQVHLVRLDTTPDGTVNQVVSSAAADDGTTMRYAGPHHIYNLSTKLSQFCTTGTPYCTNGTLTEGTYRLTITAPELPTPITATMNLRN